MTYWTKWEAAIKPDNVYLVLMAMVDVALELMADLATVATVAAYATLCLISPMVYAERLAFGVVFEASNTTDAELKSAVEAVFPYYAGVQASA